MFGFVILAGRFARDAIGYTIVFVAMLACFPALALLWLGDRIACAPRTRRAAHEVEQALNDFGDDLPILDDDDVGDERWS